MRKELLLIAMLCMASFGLRAQCPNGNVQNQLIFDCGTNQTTTISTGDYYEFDIVKDVEYNFSTTTTGFDSQIYAKQGGATGSLVFQEDATGQENFNWTATFTGTIFVAVHKNDCTWPSQSAVIGYRQLNNPALTNQTSEAVLNLCTDSSRNLVTGLPGGSWSLVTGSGVIVDSTFAPTMPDTNTVRYTIGVCEADRNFVVVDTRHNPSLLNAPTASITLTDAIPNSEVTWFSYAAGDTAAGIYDTFKLVVPEVCDTWVYATVLDTLGCTSISDTFFKACPTISSIGDLQSLDIRIFPNPSDGRVFVETAEEAVELNVISVGGMLVHKTELPAFRKTEIEGLAAGSYLFHLKGRDSQAVRRVIIR